MRCLLFTKNKGQVWVETVIYTLVGLSILGVLLVAVRPRIEKMRDESLIEQAIESLLIINGKIFETSGTKGTVIRLDLKVGKGEFVIDGINDKIYWSVPSSLQYSEESVPIQVGIVNVLTTSSDPWLVELEISYKFDIKFSGQDIKKSFSEGATFYRIAIENEGAGVNPKIILNFEEI